jgi:transposase
VWIAMVDLRAGRSSTKALETENRRLQAQLLVVERRVEDLAAHAEGQRHEIERLLVENAAQAEKIQDLEARLKTNSTNSSKPPSSDGPGIDRTAKVGRGKGKKRRRGGQPGHASTARAPILPEQADEEVHVLPEHCEHCKSTLSGRDEAPIGRPVYEMPRPRIELRWYWLHKLRCEACGCSTRARAPGSVGQSLYGANLHALCALLVGRFRQSKRLVSELVEVLYGLRIPPSSICDMEKRTSAALAGPVEEARQHVASSAVVHADETGWRMAKRKAWLWLVATGEVV